MVTDFSDRNIALFIDAGGGAHRVRDLKKHP